MPALLELGYALGSRIVLLALCRIYLSKSLYHDLQDLSRSSVSSGKENHDDIELDTLPTLSVQSSRSATTASFLFGGWRPLHSEIAQTIFSVCLAESVLLFVLLMCQGMNVSDPPVRMRHWNFSLRMLMAIVLVLVPISLSLVVNVGSGIERGKSFRSLLPRIVFSLLPVGAYLFALSHVPLPASLSASSFPSTALSRLVYLGTIVLGLLSGFGAVSNAWAFFPLFSKTSKEVRSSDVSSAEESLERVRRDLASRRAALKQRQANKTEDGRWYSRVLNFRGDEDSQEIQGLEALEHQMSRNVEDLRHRQQERAFSRTFKGRLYNWGGALFAVYCVLRVISCTINILGLIRRPSSSSTPAQTYPDLIAQYLTSILSKLRSEETLSIEDALSIARQISLGLVGVIILTSVRVVLRGVTRASRIANRHTGASLMLLVLAQLMGIYLLSTIVQLRTVFPPQLDNSIPGDPVNLFSTVPQFEVFGSLFDWCFLIAAGGTALVRWGGEKVNGAGS